MKAEPLVIVVAGLLAVLLVFGWSPSQAAPTPVDQLVSGRPPRFHLPLVLVGDVPLPGRPTRFDYQDIDRARGRLVIAHMGDSSVVVVDLATGSTLKELPNVGTVRGVLAASEIGRIFATAAGTNELVIVDAASLAETGRVPAGASPDGIGWDPLHQTVGVSNQREGALSLIARAGSGARRRVRLGLETGNVVFDATRGWFWVTVVVSPTDQLVAVDPVAGTVQARIALPGCDGAHGLRLHPDGKSALIACEKNDVLARVELDGAHLIATAATGEGPDVLAVDSSFGWLYVAAESGDLVVFDLGRPGLVAIDREHPGKGTHTIAVDPTTHRVFLPLAHGPKGKPVLRIMRPRGE